MKGLNVKNYLEIEYKDHVWLCEVSYDVVTCEYGADADGHRGALQPYIEIDNVSAVDENGNFASEAMNADLSELCEFKISEELE